MDDTNDTGRAGDSGSIIPGGPGPGMMPPADSPADEDQPLADRLGRDPSNLGDEVTDQGDVVFPDPEPPQNNL